MLRLGASARDIDATDCGVFSPRASMLIQVEKKSRRGNCLQLPPTAEGQLALTGNTCNASWHSSSAWEAIDFDDYSGISRTYTETVPNPSIRKQS
jgi:hypothetical protein